MTAIEKVSMLFERYAKVPLATSAKGEPLLLVLDDHNAGLIAKTMQNSHGDNWTLQSVIDLVRNLGFAKQLHFIIQPGHEAPPPTAQPTAPSAQPKKDGRSREQKLQDAGITPITHKASRDDMKAEQRRHQEARDKLKRFFSNDPKRISFDDELRSANAIQIYTGPGILSRTKSYDAREKARQQIRLKWPQFAHLTVQPESEKLNHRPGVF